MVKSPLRLNLDTVYLSDEQFYQLCQNNQALKFERTAKGELIIMSPVGGESGNREADLIIDLSIWEYGIDKRGLVIPLALLLSLSYLTEQTVLQMSLGFGGNAGKL